MLHQMKRSCVFANTADGDQPLTRASRNILCGAALYLGNETAELVYEETQETKWRH